MMRFIRALFKFNKLESYNVTIINCYVWTNRKGEKGDYFVGIDVEMLVELSNILVVKKKSFIALLFVYGVLSRVPSRWS